MIIIYLYFIHACHIHYQYPLIPFYYPVSISDNKDPGDQWGRKPSDVESNNTNVNKSKQSPSGGSSSSHKSRGILRILGKLKRSNSGGLDNDVAPTENSTGGPFVRGGVRATAHPRLGWMKDPSPIIKKYVFFPFFVFSLSFMLLLASEWVANGNKLGFLMPEWRKHKISHMFASPSGI